jgi:hypothetical protein
MAYVSQDKKATLSPAIKAVLKKYDMKGTISVRHHSTLVVTIKSGKLDVIGNWYETGKGQRSAYLNGHYAIEKPNYIQVNEYHIDSNYTGEVRDFLNELHEAMKGEDFFNHDDIQSDYFHRSHYVDINIGKWNTPYVHAN